MAQLGQSLSLLGAGVAAVSIGIGIAFACLINEPIYHRIGSAVILGVLPALVAYVTGRLLRRCLITLSLVYDPVRLACSRAGRRSTIAAIAAAGRIGRSGLDSADAAGRRVRQAWNASKRTTLASGDAAVTWLRRAVGRLHASADDPSFLSGLAGQLRTIAPISRRQRLPVRV